MLGPLALKFKQSGISFPNTFVAFWERTLFCVLSIHPWIYTQHLSFSTYNIFMFRKWKTEGNQETKYKKNHWQNRADSAASGGKQSKRAVFGSQRPAKLVEFLFTKVVSCSFPPLLSAYFLGSCITNKACKLIKPHFLLLLEYTSEKLLFCHVYWEKKKKNNLFSQVCFILEHYRKD